MEIAGITGENTVEPVFMPVPQPCTPPPDPKKTLLAQKQASPEPLVLILGAMPAQATPTTHVAAGAWCFAGQEHLFPNWWNEDKPACHFPLPKDPFTTSKDVVDAAMQANGAALHALPKLAEYLANIHQTRPDPCFWEMALGPWLLLICHVLTERQKRIHDLIQCYGHLSLTVPVLPPTPPALFHTSHDFMVNGVQNTLFNHYLFSRILEKQAPPTWVLCETPPYKGAPSPAQSQPLSSTQSQSLASTQSQSLLLRLRQQVAQKLQALPFPRQKGFPLWMSVLLSIQVYFSKVRKPFTACLADYATPPPKWSFAAEGLMTSLLPQSFYAQLPPPVHAKNRLRGMTPAFSQNELYRFDLARWKEGGGHLFCVQHGANYGNLASVGISIFEYMQHAFCSWGFTQHEGYRMHAQPTINPGLAALYNTHKQSTKTVVLVGTEMSTHAYRLKTRPFAQNLVQYRTKKLSFLQSLSPHIQQHTLYRPYFSGSGGLDDYSFVAEHLPHIRKCTGDLTKTLQQANLAVLDHYGTTLHTCMVANIPVVCFWQEAHWGMTVATKQIFAKFAKENILHFCPQKAADHINSIWEDIPGWWQSEAVQNARLLWLNHFALCHNNLPQIGDDGINQTDLSQKPLSQWKVYRLWSTTLARICQ